jgi:tRNA (guanine-N(7)-)-methyltransferase subunit TRM82
MAGLQHPFHCLRYVNRQSAGQSDILIATAGRNLYSYDASSGQRLDVWPQPVDANAEDKRSDAAPESESQAPPEKRRKLSSTSEEQKDAKSESKPKDSNKEASKNSWTNIPLVTAAHGKYVVIMTSEDKCVRVLSLDNEGKLQQLSAR